MTLVEALLIITMLLIVVSTISYVAIFSLMSQVNKLRSQQTKFVEELTEIKLVCVRQGRLEERYSPLPIAER